MFLLPPSCVHCPGPNTAAYTPSHRTCLTYTQPWLLFLHPPFQARFLTCCDHLVGWRDVGTKRYQCQPPCVLPVGAPVCNREIILRFIGGGTAGEGGGHVAGVPLAPVPAWRDNQPQTDGSPGKGRPAGLPRPRPVRPLRGSPPARPAAWVKWSVEERGRRETPHLPAELEQVMGEGPWSGGGPRRAAGKAQVEALHLFMGTTRQSVRPPVKRPALPGGAGTPSLWGCAAHRSSLASTLPLSVGAT